MRTLLHRIFSVFRGRALDKDLEAEIRAHLELSIEENLRRGMPLEEARRDARRSFGGVEQVKEVYREGRGLPWIEGFCQDLRYGLRQLRKSPGVAATVVISMAFAIGANTTVFSIVNGALLGTLPVKEPSLLVSLSEGESTSYPDYVAYRDQTDLFEGLSAHFPFIPASLGGAEPERVWGQVVTSNYFDVLGLPLARGRGFLPEESREYGPKAVVVISDSLWKRRFSADPGILGKAAILNNRAYTVVGVAPPGFSGEDRGFVSEFWVPISMLVEIMPGSREERFVERNHQWLMLTGRLRPGVSPRQAEAELNVIKDRIETENNQPVQDRDPPIRLTPAGGLNKAFSGFVRALMAVLMAVAVLVLLIACANVANVLLARAVDRRREMGVRLAIGAGRGRVLRQLLTESLLLAAAGAVLGVAVSFVATRLISLSQLPFPIPIRLDFEPDLRVLCFAALITVLTALLFGTAPALKATKFDLVATLKGNIDDWRKFRRFGLTNSLVVLQVALSLVLLASAGLFLRSLQKTASADIGMRPEGIVLLGFDPKLHSYSEEHTRQFLIDLRQRVEALPAVERLSFIDVVPLSLGGSRSGFSRGKEPGEQREAADVYAVDAEYFETMGVALLRGRGFSMSSDLSRDVAVINETLAAKLFPGEDALGKLVTGRGTTYEVVGIASSSRSRMIVEEQQPIIYHYMLRKPDDRTGQIGITIAVKTHADPYGLVQGIREQIHALDPNLAVFNIETMDEHVTKALMIPRLSAILLSTFGVIGVTLAAIGLYGVVGYSVRRRTREIGIRMALGADAARVTRSVMKQGFSLAAVGMIFGFPAALALSSLYRAFLYEVTPTDPRTFLAVAAVLLLIAVVASLGPARRAAKVEPMTAVRHE